jgi:hypothetical protein
MFGTLKEWVLGLWASPPASKLYIANKNVCILPASWFKKKKKKKLDISHRKQQLLFEQFSTFLSPCAIALK